MKVSEQTFVQQRGDVEVCDIHQSLLSCRSKFHFWTRPILEARIEQNKIS